MFDFGAFQSMADSMIVSNGEAMQLVSGDSAVRDIIAVEVAYLPREIDGELILTDDRRFYVQGPLTPKPNAETERLLIIEDGESSDWRIITVDPVRRKGGNTIFYELQVRSR